VGHGTHPAEGFAELLQKAGIRALVDIRIGPGSRRNPQFQRAAMADWLPATGIDYRWERRLGGFRPLPPDSPDTALRNESFRGYAAHMRTPEFHAALADVRDRAAPPPTRGRRRRAPARLDGAASHAGRSAQRAPADGGCTGPGRRALLRRHRHRAKLTISQMLFLPGKSDPSSSPAQPARIGPHPCRRIRAHPYFS
jgi:hypothetical protein